MNAIQPGIIGGVATLLACAALGLAGCGGKSAGSGDAAAGGPAPLTFPHDPTAWTCRHFDEASEADLTKAINELVAGNHLGGRRAQLEAAIRSICSGVSPDFTPTQRAIAQVEDANPAPLDQPGESSSSGGGSSGGGSTEPPADPQRAPSEPSQPPSAPPTGPPQDETETQPPHEGGGCCGRPSR